MARAKTLILCLTCCTLILSLIISRSISTRKHWRRKTSSNKWIKTFAGSRLGTGEEANSTFTDNSNSSSSDLENIDDGEYEAEDDEDDGDDDDDEDDEDDESEAEDDYEEIVEVDSQGKVIPPKPLKETQKNLGDKNPVKKNESQIVVPCTGFTCKFQDTCGSAPLNPLSKVRPKGKTPYVVYGEEQVYGEWPQYVRLLLHDFTGICGGVLISDMHVLTAAHCTYFRGNVLKPEDMIARLGDHSRQRVDTHERNYKVASICRSYRYVRNKRKALRYDYSILTLTEPVKFGDYMQPACLPYKSLNIGVSGRHIKCYIMGLGKMQHEKSAPSVQKLRVRRTRCTKWNISDDDRSRYCFIASKRRGDSCKGDSGGPVLCYGRDRKWTIAGLVSYGSMHCDGTEDVGWVAVYTRIRALLRYIQDDCGI